MTKLDIIRAAVVVTVASALVGCARPRVVTAITGRGDQMKFLYVEGNEQGLVRCKVAPDGALSGCQNVAVALEED